MLSTQFSLNLSAECIEGNCDNGYGTYIFSNGDQYVGAFKDNKRHGQGTFTFANGNQYVGAFKDDKRHGQGTLTGPDGDILANGVWVDDQFENALKATPKESTSKIKYHQMIEAIPVQG